MKRYLRDMSDYARRVPAANRPDGARIAMQMVLNYEEGGENCVLRGDPASEAFLSGITGAQPWPGQRHCNMESNYEYGSRAGFWCVHDLQKALSVTVYGVATALARASEQVVAMKDAGWETASRGLKWIEHKDMPAEDERAQIREATRLYTEVVGTKPGGWYTGRRGAASTTTAILSLPRPAAGRTHC